MATDNPLWNFSLAVYAIEGVAPACLRLQDRHGLDVNLLLYCCWAGQSGLAVDAPALLRLTADWQARVVQPLRAARRTLKDEADLGRGAAAKLELQAERIEQDALAAASPPSTQSGRPELARQNLDHYLAAAGVAVDSAARADIDLLIAACEAWPA